LTPDALGAGAGLAVPAGATGVTLGYWKMWEAACMCSALYAWAALELRSRRIKQCCSPPPASLLARGDEI
jgi:hypothetical protein